MRFLGHFKRRVTSTRQLANGEWVRLTQDYVAPPPPRTVKRTRWLPIWHIIFFIYFILVMRLLAMAEMGVTAYQSRMDEMRNGMLIERAVSYLMLMDPVSESIAFELRQSLRAWAKRAATED